MNKNEFYKGLMDEYSFDKERIKMNAKRAAPSFVSKQHIFFTRTIMPMASAAALLVVSVGAVWFMNATKPLPVEVTPNVSPLSIEQRLEDARRNYDDGLRSTAQNSKLSEMYLSLSEPIPVSKVELMLSAASDIGDIQIKAYYTENGKRVAYDATNMGTDSAIAVKVLAPLKLFSAIQDLEAVTIVDVASASINDDTFVPVTPEEYDLASQAPLPTTEPPVITLPPVTTSEEVTATTVEDTTSVTEETTDAPETTDVETIDTSETDEEIPETLAEETTMATVTTSSEEAPIEFTMFQLSIDKACKVNFINENTFVIIKQAGISLYTITDDKRMEKTSDVITTGARVVWADPNETTMIVSSLDDGGKRTKLWLINGANSSINELDTTSIIANSEISNVFYTGGIAVIKTISTTENKNYIYTATLSQNTLVGTLQLTQNGVLTPLAFYNNLLYTSTKIDDRTCINRLNIVTHDTFEVASYNGSTRFARSPSFTNFAIVNDSIASSSYQIYMPEFNSFAKLSSSAVTFSSIDANVFTDGYNFYRISVAGSTIIPSNEGINYFPEYKNSTKYEVNEVTDSTVKIKIITPVVAE